VWARRYGGRGIGSPLGFLVTFGLLKQYGPIRLPGVRLLAGGFPPPCPRDGDELIDNGDGTGICQYCGTQYEFQDEG
jgi:hypothetical protein